MIANAAESHLISNLGWVDHGAIWVCETGSAAARQVVLSDAGWLSLYRGSEDLFAAVHWLADDHFEISAHRIAAPEDVRARVVVRGGRPVFEGDRSVWQYLPRAYRAFSRYSPTSGPGKYHLCLIDHREETIEMQPFAWYEDGPYD